MTTPIWITGFEHGLPTPSVNGGGLIDAITGSCSVTGTANTGEYSLKCSATGSVMAYISRNIPAGQTFVGRFYIRLDTLPTADKILFSITTVGHKIQLSFKQSDSKLYFGVDGALTTVSSFAVAAETYYEIDVKAVTSANPWTIDWRLDYVAQTQSTYAHAAEDMSVVDYGLRTTGTQSVYYDDIIHSVTAGDYPIGPGGTFGLRPSADGTHNNAANVMEDALGNDINGTTYPAWNKLEENPWVNSVSDWIRQQNVGSDKYCEIQYADCPETVWGIIGVDALLQYASSGTTANTGGCIIRDGGGTETELWGKVGGLQDYSETSAFYKHAIIPGPGGSWDKSEVDAVRCRFGYSDNVASKPYWLATILEVAYSLPLSSILTTDMAVMVGDREDVSTIRVTNAAVVVGDREDVSTIRVTNFAIIVGWVPPGLLGYDITQVI